MGKERWWRRDTRQRVGLRELGCTSRLVVVPGAAVANVLHAATADAATAIPRIGAGVPNTATVYSEAAAWPTACAANAWVHCRLPTGLRGGAQGGVQTEQSGKPCMVGRCCPQG